MNTSTAIGDLRIDNPLHEKQLKQFGFRWGDKGTHTSRTIMLDELRSLLGLCDPDSDRDKYLSAIEDGNCLRKRTVATRNLSSQRLSELYALDPRVPLFRSMRRFWYADPEARPILALLLALARDPLLRASAPPILGMRPGEELSRQAVTDALARAVGGRLNLETLDKVVRNTASSWTQSGHLSGRGRKTRRRVTATPAATAYALFVNYLAGGRGHLLFEGLWVRVLDADEGELIQLAGDARRLGFLDMNQSGGVVDVSFPRFLA